MAHRLRTTALGEGLVTLVTLLPWLVYAFSLAPGSRDLGSSCEIPFPCFVFHLLRD